jgi:CBS domain containing-hemolysin-like protein
MVELLPWLIAMGVLLLGSGFFSSSEAAFFLLNLPETQSFAKGNRPQRVAAHLLSDPDRLLTAVLFWNLVINVGYFAIISIVALHLKHIGNSDLAGVFTLGALVAIMLFSEMLPKSVAVLKPQTISTLFAIPLAVAIRVVDPLLPVFRWTNILSRRLFWPRFEPEPYLDVTDLERAVAFSTSDAILLGHEKTVLQNIVVLSTIRVDEMMRPRMQFLTFSPPVGIDDLHGRPTPSGYILITEKDSDEVTGAISINALGKLPRHHLESHAQQVFYLPWCATGGQALEQMLDRNSQVAAVVNEFGETVGILTFDDILDTIFTPEASRSERLFRRLSLQNLSAGRWQVTGMTTLRRLGRRFDVTLPATKNTTVAGAVQEVLGRVPQTGDRCDWGPFHFKVADVPERGQMILVLTLLEKPEPFE